MFNNNLHRDYGEDNKILEQFVRLIKSLLDPIKRRVFLMIARGIVENVNDGEGVQFLQVSLLAGELRDELEHFGNYGFTSSPPVGSEAVVVFVGGNRDHGIVVGIDDRDTRIKSQAEGEVTIYDKQGQYIKFKEGNIIEIKGGIVKIEGSTSIELKSPSIDLIP